MNMRKCKINLSRYFLFSSSSIVFTVLKKLTIYKAVYEMDAEINVW